ncbi:MAG: serine hydrolase domain-containing protein [Pseudomonadota bacterium]
MRFGDQQKSERWIPDAIGLPGAISLILLSVMVWPLAAQGAEQAPLVDWTSVGEQMSPVIVRRMADDQIPGVVLVVVKGRRVLLSAGYGVANIDTGQPVLPSQTRFRLASLSKPFTALAAAMLADKGQLELDADIRQYLGDGMPHVAFPDSITMRQLLTHTAGFDNTDIGDAAHRKEDVLTLAEFVAQRMTRQTQAPGERYKYANPGFALAGRVIETVSGDAYHDHMAQQLLAPLGMDSATFSQPQADETIATGHLLTEQGALATIPYDYTQTAPADALLATADDMAEFLVFQLGRGPDIISDTGLAMTQTRQFSQTGSWPGMALGWVDERRTGRPMVEHSGGTPGFTSYMAVFPEHDVGVFIALNRRDSGSRIGMLIELWNRFLPMVDVDETSSTEQRTDPGRPLADYEGVYRNGDFPMGDMQRVPGYLGLYDDLVVVEAEASGLLIDERAYVPVGVDEFRLTGTDLIQRFDFSGSVPTLLKGRYAYDRVVWYERPTMVGSFLISLILLSAFTGTRSIRRLYRLAVDRSDAVYRPAHVLADVSGVGLLLSLGFYVHVTLLAIFNDGLDYGLPLTGYLMLPVAMLTSLLVLVALVYHVARLNAAGVRTQPGFRTDVIVLLASLLGLTGAWFLRMFVAI